MFYLLVKHLVMTSSELLQARLSNQQISAHQFQTPGEVVKWLGAVQAQDYLSALYAIGLRMNETKEAAVEKAIADKTIVRTWPMRGTLHFVPAEDAKWMLALLTPRIISRAQGIYRQSGLDKNVFVKSRKLVTKALQGGNQLERKEIYAILEMAKISTSETRGLHILGFLAQEGLICFGSRMGKKQSFVLLDEWIPVSKNLKGNEALAELAKRYFTSHGPASLQDFAWWSGLTVSAAKEGLNPVKNFFVEEKINGQSFWMTGQTFVNTKTLSTYLLPAYDEYLVAYRDRSAALETIHTKNVLNSNGIFSPSLIINGKVEGTWRRTIDKNEVLLQILPFKPLSQIKKRAISLAAKQYSNFLGAKLKLQY